MVIKTYVEIRLRNSAFATGGKFAGQNPSTVQFIVGNKSNSNQALSDFHQSLVITCNSLMLTKEEFGQLGVGPKLQLADLSSAGILYVKYNNRVLSTFEIANFSYDIITKVEKVQSLVTAPLSFSTYIPITFVLDKVLISFSGVVTETVQTIYVTSDGTEFVLDSQALVASSVYTYLDSIDVDEGDQIKVTCTDGGGVETATAIIFVKRRWDGQ